MNLSQKRFSRGTVTKRYAFHQAIIDQKFNRYTYETYNAIYDVDIRINGVDQTGEEKHYSTNCNRRIDKPTAIHKAIENHFNLSGGI